MGYFPPDAAEFDHSSGGENGEKIPISNSELL